MVGIEFTFKDGSKEYYDPIDYPQDFEENDDYYLLHMTYEYEVLKEDVESFRLYDLCEECGHELFDNECNNCAL